jgi:transcriptional regulator of heat shock response
MTSRWADIKARKDKILTITINQYINTSSPVSSSFIAEEYLLDLSSATIRNVLAELEYEGYLTQPHTSAGRIPTEKGYRYYVDYLMEEIQLLEAEKEHIKAEYKRASLALDSLLDKTSQVISNTTQYTSIISVDGWDNKLFCGGTSFVACYPDYQDIDKIRSILVALDEKEKLLEIINKKLARKIEIFIGHEMTLSEINNCSLVVSSFKTKEGPSGRIAVLGPTRMHYERVVPTLNYFATLMEEILSD